MCVLKHNKAGFQIFCIAAYLLYPYWPKWTTESNS